MIETESIKYLGSKKKLLSNIFGLVTPLNSVKTVLDGFSGSTRVSQVFAQNDFWVTANDTAVYSGGFGNLLP